MENEGFADVDCIRGEMDGVRFFEDKTFFYRDPAFDLGIGSGVERGWVVQEISSLERAETGVEMVEPLINKPETDHLDAEQLSDERVRIEFCPKTIPRPEQGVHAIEKRVACAFEWQILRQFVHAEAMMLKPVTKMGFFGLTFPV